MPELPEVERARRTLELALDRRIVEVDDTDSFVCRPHPPGEIRSALLGRMLTVASRQGKSMWSETSGRESDPEPGPFLGIHLGMGGVLVVTEPDGSVQAGGDPFRHRDAEGPQRWDRFTVTFADGGSLVLFDKRRLGRIRLEPHLEQLGPDAQFLAAKDFVRVLTGTGAAPSRAPVKARLLDQHVLAGVGNLLADEALWQAKIHPASPVAALDRRALGRLHRAVLGAIAAAVKQGGVHTGRVIPARKPGGRCPRCRAAMERGVVGTRTTWWCSKEQVRAALEPSARSPAASAPRRSPS